MTYFLGLTGGIASGKSTVSHLFMEKGVKIIDADQIAHQLLQPNGQNWQNVVHEFGAEFLLNSGEINREKLGKLVFADKSALRKLNEISQPVILAEIKQQMGQARNADEKFVVVDIPLLYEENYTKILDAVLVVYVDEATQLTRLLARNNISKEEAKQKISSQMSLEKKKKSADYLIDNTGTIEKTICLFEELWQNQFSPLLED